MARSPIAGTFMLTGSLSMLAPAGMTTEGFPANVTGWLEPAAMFESLSLIAKLAAPTVRAAVPNAFVKTTRARLPPRLTWTTSRMVAFARLGGA
jgi:hypothetical protein